MESLSLRTISPIDGRYLSKTQTLQNIFSEFALMKYRLLVEIRWFQSLVNNPDIKELPLFDKQEHSLLDKIINEFSLKDADQIKKLEKQTNHDVKAVEYFIKEKFMDNSSLQPLIEFVHFACTSEDINNLAYGLMLKQAREQTILPLLTHLIKQLRQHAHQYADLSMLSHTHGQAATPTTLGKEFANFVARLSRPMHQLKQLDLMGKINGAVGNFNAHTVVYPEVDWETHSARFVESLGLSWNQYTTQIEPHDYIGEFCHILIRINNILLDFSRDMWGYISLGYFKQQLKSNEVGSSTMPHKINPINFENAEGNLMLANSLLTHMANELATSRWQRDLTDSTLLRNLGVCVGHCLIAYNSLNTGIDKCHPDQNCIHNDLEQNWAVLAEVIQVMMRRYGIEQAYEQLKGLTRGQEITKDVLLKFIEDLELPQLAKTQLQSLSPHQYIGYARRLAEII